MALAHHAQVLAFIQAPAVEGHQGARLRARRQVGQRGGEVAHGHVGLAGLQQAARVARGQRQHADADAGRLALQQAEHGRNQRGGRGVGHGQHKGGGGGGGVEFAWRQRVLQLLQRLADHGPQRQRARRGLHALALAHQELVAQRLAQAAQRIAHGRLGDGQLVGRPREAALRHHLVEDAQQVQIQCAEVQGGHGRGSER
ncbi:hypothetical protein COLO4_01743 [Corchorus olitorius]|uniref:Uncharacterized protein n=1 Tax=Corchorus olitorius TaxID=93759 RepID=A0A1R3L218_9ROSI|nr:hypothetical protein COLO4_01743 [Corchorus olitorius]